MTSRPADKTPSTSSLSVIGSYHELAQAQYETLAALCNAFSLLGRSLSAAERVPSLGAGPSSRQTSEDYIVRTSPRRAALDYFAVSREIGSLHREMKSMLDRGARSERRYEAAERAMADHFSSSERAIRTCLGGGFDRFGICSGMESVEGHEERIVALAGLRASIGGLEKVWKTARSLEDSILYPSLDD